MRFNMRIKSINEVEIRECDGEEPPATYRPILTVISHGWRNRAAVLVFGVTNITVDGDELLLAIANAQNVGSL